MVKIIQPPVGTGFFYTMPADIIHDLVLTKVGTNVITVRVEDNKVWVTIVDNGNPQESFFVLNYEDWVSFKDFVDKQIKFPKLSDFEVIEPEIT